MVTRGVRVGGPDPALVKAPTASNVSPAEGCQPFGEVDIDGDGGDGGDGDGDGDELTVRPLAYGGTVPATRTLQPGPVGQ